MFEIWEIVEAAVRQCSDNHMKKCYVCMLIDYVAALNNMTSEELIDELMPMIKTVNEDMGVIPC